MTFQLKIGRAATRVAVKAIKFATLMDTHARAQRRAHVEKCQAACLQRETAAHERLQAAVAAAREAQAFVLEQREITKDAVTQAREELRVQRLEAWQ